MRSLLRFVVLSLVLSGSACTNPRDRKPPDVLLVILDTTRADHFSSYGYSLPTTPNLDRLAVEGERYTQAWAQSSWTLPTVATILTGQPPHVHGAGRGRLGMHGIRPDTETIAERMSSAGYATAAVINVTWCSPRLSSLDRGFDSYDYFRSDEQPVPPRDARATTDAALGWIRKQHDKPFFLVVHYFDPHLPYAPPASFNARFKTNNRGHVPRSFGREGDVVAVREGRIRLTPDQRRTLIRRYDGELLYTDDQIGRLRGELERSGRWKDTLVIVTADHGEEFWEHGSFEHGHSHHREVTRVPLLVRRPGSTTGSVRDERVSQIDIVPTILDVAGLTIPADLPGRPLGSGESSTVIAEGNLWGGSLVSVRSDRGTVMLDRSSGSLTYYSAEDSLELEPSSEAPPDTGALVRLLRDLPDPVLEGEPAVKLREDEIRQLRSLGYLR